MRRFMLWSVPVMITAMLLYAADKDEKKPANVFTDPAEAGPDYKIQGEYEGEIVGKGKVGAQVVAKGEGKFEVYFLKGGLPGAGWDTKERVKVDAKTEGEKVILAGKTHTGGIAGSSLTGKTEGGEEFKLSKVDRKSPSLEARPPEGATVLFDGSSADSWNGGKIVEEKLLNCGTSSKKQYGLGKLHIEFRTPFQPKAGGQGRGNSGVYVMGKEVQVLDSFGLTGANNECGAVYSESKPSVNMCLPPLVWQTYDIELTKGENDEVFLTVHHNGVKVQDNFSLKKAKPASINLQNHGNPVAYRNIWFVEAK